MRAKADVRRPHTLNLWFTLASFPTRPMTTPKHRLTKSTGGQGCSKPVFAAGPRRAGDLGLARHRQMISSRISQPGRGRKSTITAPKAGPCDATAKELTADIGRRSASRCRSNFTMAVQSTCWRPRRSAAEVDILGHDAGGWPLGRGFRRVFRSRLGQGGTLTSRLTPSFSLTKAGRPAARHPPPLRECPPR